MTEEYKEIRSLMPPKTESSIPSIHSEDNGTQTHATQTTQPNKGSFPNEPPKFDKKPSIDIEIVGGL